MGGMGQRAKDRGERVWRETEGERHREEGGEKVGRGGRDRERNIQREDRRRGRVGWGEQRAKTERRQRGRGETESETQREHREVGRGRGWVRQRKREREEGEDDREGN